MRLSIIIVNWNTRSFLERCLISIEKYPPKEEFEIWLVDNASSDGSVEIVREKYPKVNIIQNSQNLGFARANNQAVIRASGRYILLLNPDTEVRPHALEQLVSFMDSRPKAGAVGPRTLNSDHSLQVSCHPFPTLISEFWGLFHMNKIFLYGTYPLHRWNQNEPRAVDVLKGACILIRREVLLQVGLLDEDYFMYSEEMDLCFRIKKNNWDIYWFPQVEVIHHGAQATQQKPLNMFLWLYKSKVMYFRKQYGRVVAWLYKLLLLSATLVRLLISPFALFETNSRRKTHLTQARFYKRLLTSIIFLLL